MKTFNININDGQRTIYHDELRGYPQLFCIHGAMGLGSDSLISGLSPLSKIFDLIFIDLRGCGNSASASNGKYGLDDFAQDIMEISKKIPANTNRGILGHSLGGFVAIKTMAMYPGLFNFGIHSNSAHDDSWQPYASDSVKVIQDKIYLEKSLEAYEKSPNDQTVRDLAIAYGPVYFQEQSQSQARKSMANFKYRNDAMEYCSAHVYPGMNLESELKSIHSPLLIISGEKDIVVPVSCQQSTAKVSNSDLVIIKNAGHFPFITEQEEFTRSITNWWIIIRSQLT